MVVVERVASLSIQTVIVIGHLIPLVVAQTLRQRVLLRVSCSALRRNHFAIYQLPGLGQLLLSLHVVLLVHESA